MLPETGQPANPGHRTAAAWWAALVVALSVATPPAGDAPAPGLDVIFPPGAAIGQSTTVRVSGKNLEGLLTLHCGAPGVVCKKLNTTRFTLAVSGATPPGLYDLWVVGEGGISSPRTFAIGNRAELLEAEPNDPANAPQSVTPDVVINGCIDKPGDVDHYRFRANKGQRIVLECFAERIDSRLRAVLELFDAAGKRLAANRGYSGVDPLIDFRAPADGDYTVKLHDLIFAGGPEHSYRLDIDGGPRVAFAVPGVIQHGKAARVRLYGWNLMPRAGVAHARLPPPSEKPSPPGDTPPLDHLDVDIPASQATASWPLPVRLQPAQVVTDGFAYHLPGSHAVVMIGVTDVPVAADRPDNHTPATAQPVSLPCEVSGRLVGGDECDWFAIQVKRGEVLHLEALGQRIGSPVDLHLCVLDAAGERELARFGDEVRNVGGKALPTNHLDPAGRWVVPADGRYLIALRNLTGGLADDPRRVYRLSVRREEPDCRLIAFPRQEGPAGLTLRRGGREVLEVVALRRRGMTGPIRVVANNLPEGVECPDVWLGPGVDRTTVVVTATNDAVGRVGELKLEGIAEGAARRPVRGGTVVRAGTPTGWGRLTSHVPFVVAGDAPLRVTADGHEAIDHHLYGKLKVRHAPGGIVDLAVRVDRRDGNHRATVRLTAVGLPDAVRNQVAVIPRGEEKGYVSLYLPPELPVGRYSVVIRAETTAPAPGNTTQSVIAYSNPVTIDVRPAAFLVEVDPFAPTRVKRGETIQVGYSAVRRDGFIGKIHTELAAPGRVTDVPGLRGRGETFVGQTDRGSLQIVVNKDAPLGRQPFLRLFSVGVVEDEPDYHGASFLALEIID